MGGGSQSTSVTIPAWLEDAAKKGIARAERVSGIGYTPYYGPDVAAMTPAQVSSMQGTNQMASAFGMPTSDVTAGMPSATNYNGMSAYSSGGMYDAALAELKARNPGQYAAIQDMFVNPKTGAAPGAGTAAATASNAAKAAAARGGRDDNFEYGRGSSGGRSTASSGGGGTGSLGLPDPMSGRITSIGPIGRQGGGGMGRGK